MTRLQLQVDQHIDLANELQREYPAEFDIKEQGYLGWVATYRHAPVVGYGESAATAMLRLIFEMRLQDLIRTKRMHAILDILHRHEFDYRKKLDK